MYKIDYQTPCSIYFVGIGGISMSGLAEILANAGFRVSGSDNKRSAISEHLESIGITVYYGQRKENITSDIDCAVFTAAIAKDNPEYEAVKSLQIPYLTRAQLLGQIMTNYKTPIAVSGTHGKTTTTSILGDILLQADTDPTLSIGGILKSIHGNIRIGESDIFLTEACEYTNSFLSFSPKISLILNIEEDHMDFFQDIHDIRSSFHKFAALLPPDGSLIINGAISNVEEMTKELDCNIITYGFDDSNDYYIETIEYDDFAYPSFSLRMPDGDCCQFSIKIRGEHNISNAVAAIAVADLLHIDRVTIQKAILEFSGTDRRFEYKGTIGGLTIIDDYAHHPTEITVTLKAAKKMPHKNLWCVFQPHTYSRTKTFLDDFAAALSFADKVVLADIFAARETDTLGISSEDLLEKLKALGCECYYFPSFNEIENFLLENCINGDVLITMGAGDVNKVGENLLGL